MNFSELSYNKRAILDNLPCTPVGLRIRGLFAAYGCGRSFVRFFSDEQGRVIAAVKDGSVYMHLPHDMTAHESDAASKLVRLLAAHVLTEQPLDGLAFQLDEQGRNFRFTVTGAKPDITVSTTIESGRPIVEQAFPEAVNSTSFPMWYTDLSHRVRHEVSMIYTYDSCCTATAYATVNGVCLIVQLATLPDERGKGRAMQLMQYIAVEKQASALVLSSQNAVSDQFYCKHGFEDIGPWYYYTM